MQLQKEDIYFHYVCILHPADDMPACDVKKKANQSIQAEKSISQPIFYSSFNRMPNLIKVRIVVATSSLSIITIDRFPVEETIATLLP